jgi:hypothetical protein
LEPNANKSLIPCHSKQKRRPPSAAKSDSDAELEDTASSTMSTASIAIVDGSPKSVLDAEAALAMRSSFNQHELPHSAIIKQVS